jgi:uncharacterized membrane protein HdeD (DUF308 family)
MERAEATFSWRWAALVGRGVIAILAGIAAFVVSVNAARALLVAYFVADGALALILASRARIPSRIPARFRVLIGAAGVVDLVVALLLVKYAPAGQLLILIVSMWAIATGMLEFIAAILIPKVTALSWAIALVGVASCALGIAVIDLTNLAEIGVLTIFAVYTVTAGILFVAFGIALARAFRRPSEDRPVDAGG